MRLSACLLAFLPFALQADCLAQVIQLPSFSSFSVNTTVLVPDSGPSQREREQQAIARDRARQWGGIPRKPIAGNNRQLAGAQALAQIHDRKPAAAAPSLASVAELKQQRAAQAAAEQREALALVEKARHAQTAGKPSVAAIYYRAAARQAAGTLRQEIDAELHALPTPSATASPQKTKTVRTSGQP